MQFTRTSILSGITRTKELDVTEEQYNAWQDGALIQNVMPHLSDDDREFLISGATAEEWDSLEEDDDYEYGDDDEYDDGLSSREREINDRLDMGRNEAGEWVGFM